MTREKMTRAREAANVAECVVRVGGGGRFGLRVLVPVVGFADPGGGVEEEWKPANPGPELVPADGLDAGWEVERVVEERVEDGEDGRGGCV